MLSETYPLLRFHIPLPTSPPSFTAAPRPSHSSSSSASSPSPPSVPGSSPLAEADLGGLVSAIAVLADESVLLLVPFARRSVLDD